MSQDVTNCPKCARRTPAARGACIYCGESLPVTAIAAAPPQRNIDHSELAFNAIVEPSLSSTRESVSAALAAALNIESGEAEAMLAAAKPIPIARCHNRQEAEMIAGLARNCGLSAMVVADEDLRLDTELMRARRIERRESEVVVHHAAGVAVVPVAEIRLMVLGSLKSVRVEYTESGGGVRSQSGSVLDTSEFRFDEMMLDVYSTSLERSFRIKSDAFDYSGLVWPMSFRAEVNFRAAVAVLRSAAPRAAFDDDFSRVRSALSRAWPERTRNEAQGIKRAGLSYRPVAKASVVSDNRDQFERYSRLAFHQLTAMSREG